MSYLLSPPLPGVASGMRWTSCDAELPGLVDRWLPRRPSGWRAIFDMPVPRTRLADFESLPSDWDGYGALPISEQVRQNAEALLSLFSGFSPSLPPPEIAPHANGTISLEWEVGQAEAYLEIGKTRISGYIRSQAGETYLIEGNADEVDETLARLLEEHIYPCTELALPVTSLDMAA